MTQFSLPQIHLSSSIPRDCEVLILGLASATKAPVLIGLPESRKAGTKRDDLLALAISLGAKPKPDSVVTIPTSDGPHVIVVGLSEVDVTHEEVRRAVGNAMRAATSLPCAAGGRAAISLDIVEPSVIKGAVEGALLGAYDYAKVGAERKAGFTQITIVAPTKSETKQAVEMAQAVATAVNTAREWVNTPANLLYPKSFAASAKELVTGSPVTVEILDEIALENQGFGGILAVGGGSARKPRLVKLSYAPRGAKFHLALVGKGITFDSGGLDLKPADAMYTMKCDMAGAAAVLAATKAIAELGLKVKVTAYAAMAENLPSSTAYRPSDVLTMHGGKTVENANTDAEGRLVLADALDLAGTDRPNMIVDIATLTGACMIALGTRTAGLMASDDATADLVLDAAEAAGESFWQLPIPEEIRKGLESKVADLRSSGTARYGGALTAAAFLQEFVPAEIPWAHLDIAGPAFNETTPFDYVPVGGTGSGVRTLIALAHSLQS